MKSISDYFRWVIPILTVVLSYVSGMAQAKIGDNPTVIDPNSILELESPNQGLLMPRVSLTATTSATPLTAHIAGMTVYNTTAQNDVLPGYYYNDGTKWVKVLSSGLGPLNTPTVIGTSPTNTLSITGLGAGNPLTDEILTIDPVTGLIKKTAISSLIIEEQMLHVAAGGQTQFPTPMPITDIDKINVYRNGARIGAIIVNSTTIALEAGVICVPDDEIRIVQIK